MKTNYHTHTYRCNHAADAHEREYIKQAIKAGFTDMGFADHCPMPLLDGMDPSQYDGVLHVRMTPEETADYVNTLLELREQYKNEIDIHIGFEVEYFPELFDKFIEFISQFPIDYLILGQHFGSVNDTFWFGRSNRSEEELKLYVDLCIEAIKTGKFTYVAHPDLCNFRGEIDVYEREMTRLIKCANEYSVPLEINICGLQEMRSYPNIQFWQLASEIGCDVVLGSDAHKPENVYNAAAVRQAESLVAHYPGLHLVEKLNLISPITK